MSRLHLAVLFFSILVLSPYASRALVRCETVFATTELKIFKAATKSSGPSLHVLLRYGEATPRGSVFRIHGADLKVTDWGLDPKGNTYIRFTDSKGVQKEFSPKDFPRGAFRLTQVRLDDVMKYQNEIVLDRILRDHPELNQAQAQAAFDGMKQFFFAKFRAFIEGQGSDRAPYMYNEIDIIDYSWHSFLLFTNDYHDFGRRYFHTFLHHRTQSMMDRQSGVVKAVIHSGPRASDVHRKTILEFMRETLGEDTYQSWFVRQDFNPSLSH